MSKPERVKAADMYSDAYVYYNSVGNSMYFIPGNGGVGEIYYATKAKSAVGNEVLYTTLGWKVNVYNSDNTLIESIYYKLGGPNMQNINRRIVDGYEYNLYMISFTNIKSRLSATANQILGMPNSYLVFDACTTTKIGGVEQGGITDYGYAWGRVYTTYEGIATAQNWSSETLGTLYSYYNKRVSGLNHSVTLSGGKGIKSISGMGNYCYGAVVSLGAAVEEGYEFSYWTDGYNQFKTPGIDFFMYTFDVHFHAEAKPLDIRVHFSDRENPNLQMTRRYTYDTVNQTLPKVDWKKEGYHQLGWNEKADGSGQEYDINYGITNGWILKHLPEKNLYATWDVNRYYIIYDTNGGSGEIREASLEYFEKVKLKEDGYWKERATLVGWSSEKDALEPEFGLGQNMEVSDLVKSFGLEYTHGATITLYAVWDLAPEIVGENIYLDMEDAKAGLITEEWISQYVIAQDREDGVLEYGYQETDGKSTSFIITDYSKETFMGAEEEQIVKLNFRAIDSVENKTEKMIKVYIVDMSPYDDRWILGAPRFISRRYYKNAKGEFLSPQEGGLEEDSIWIKDETYSKLLDSVLGIR